MPAPLILIPPSEGKAPGGRRKPWSTHAHRSGVLQSARREVIDALVIAMKAPAAERQKLLGVGEAATDSATAANLAVDQSPTLAAIERYDGVLYGALDHRSLTGTDKRRLNQQVLIFSGLWGAVAPDDPIPDYKLKMGATLPGLGKLSTWWRPRLADYLDERSAKRTVWNLLPNEHAAAWRPGPAVTRVLRVEFLDDVERRGERQLVTVNHWNKLLKGALVRHVLATQLTNPKGLADFTHPEGYHYRGDLTRTDGGVTTVAMVAVR